MVFCAIALLGGCPGSSSVNDAGVDDAALDFLSFSQDIPALGGDWYEYREEQGHLLEPYPRAYIVRNDDDDETFAFHILSYYDTNTAESGRFSLQTRVFSQGSWQGEQTLVASKNIKSEGPVCFKSESAGARVVEESCDGDQWMLMFRVIPFAAPEGPIVVARPAAFVRSFTNDDAAGHVFLATLDGQEDLSNLPSPLTLSAEDPDAACAFSEFAISIPQCGRALADFNVDTASKVHLFLNAQRELYRVMWEPVGETALQFSVASLAFSLEDNRLEIPLQLGSVSTFEIEVPAADAFAFVQLSAEDGLPSEARLLGISPPHALPDERAWDLMLFRPLQGLPISATLSSSSLAFNTGAPASSFLDSSRLSSPVNEDAQ
ncbi:MAG: hypothetical protein GY822_11520 [Deltaproteobacteria bacterium]|nr:hypothetical protein [Deltaproteobacteria bacterium]